MCYVIYRLLYKMATCLLNTIPSHISSVIIISFPVCYRIYRLIYKMVTCLLDTIPSHISSVIIISFPVCYIIYRLLYKMSTTYAIVKSGLFNICSLNTT